MILEASPLLAAVVTGTEFCVYISAFIRGVLDLPTVYCTKLLREPLYSYVWVFVFELRLDLLFLVLEIGDTFCLGS